MTDPNVPPLPPHVTLKQACAFTTGLARGEPGAGSVPANTAREPIGSGLPGR